MFLAPPLCWSCRAPAARSSPLCPRCRASLRFIGASPESGLERAPPDHAFADASPDDAFARTPPDDAFVWAALAYDGPARALVRGLKFHGALAVADAMAAFMAASVPPERLRGELVPVPLHPARRRRRGFNQAERLAQALGPRTGLRVSDCLARRGSALRQVGRGRSARLAGPAGSVAVRGRVPARAVLVDDVVTTGATLVACAHVLRDAGATEVAALVFARTPAR